MFDNTIVNEILKERNRQIELSLGGDTQAFDRTNTQNDWIAYINAYLGRASQRVLRNEKEAQSFRINMIKVGALVLAAIESYDKGNC